MRRRTSLLLLLTLVALLLAPSPAGAGPENPGADEARFVQLINAERAKKGIAPLQVDGQLTAASRSWAAHQLGGGCGADKNICHASSLSTGVSADWVKLGENVGTGGSVDAVMTGFIRSSAHYQNLMDPAFTRVGVGVVWSADGSRITTTHRFMQVAGESAGAGAARESQAKPAPQPKSAPAPKAPRSSQSAPPATDPPPPTTTAPPPPVAAPSRVSVVLHALQSAAL